MWESHNSHPIMKPTYYEMENPNYKLIIVLFFGLINKFLFIYLFINNLMITIEEKRFEF